MSDEIFDVVVVGAGLTASLAIDAMIRRGQRVCVLERGRDEPYAPRHDGEVWREATRALQAGDGRIFSQNSWAEQRADPDNPLFDDLCFNEIAEGGERFHYNMRMGYGGSGAVWSGRAWRYFPEDFATRSRFGYGLDWPVSAEEMAPYYHRAEALLDVSGPDDPSWPWPSNFQTSAFPLTDLDRTLAPVVSGPYRITPTVDAARNLPTREGGCVGSKTCVQFCPANAIARPHIKLIEPLRGQSDRLAFRFDAQTTHLELDTEGDVAAAHVRSRSGETARIAGRRFLLCGNTIENIRILLNSERVGGRPVANGSGLLGRNFATHGGLLARVTHKRPLNPGQGRISTAAGLDRALGRDRAAKNAHMLEIFNFDFRRWTSEASMNRLRRETRLRGRALFAAAERFQRQTLISQIYELELRPENRVELSEARDARGAPAAKIAFRHSARDEATKAHLQRLFESFAAHSDCEAVEEIGAGLNGNHPIGGYVASADPREGVVDPFGRAHDHDNLWIFGGGAMNSTSCFNPTLTITANTMRMLDDPRLA